ncbi:MAG: DHA2 family efflux MFS transporter permease subunit [Acidimicrobiia bacterium]|nr:DHA2 family efflux MFS transporter permease subunit [Acidimicrobiia bacterium]
MVWSREFVVSENGHNVGGRSRGPHLDSGTKPRIFVTFAGLMLVMLLATMDQAIVATALPTIVSDLGGLEQLAWVVTAYILGVAITTPLYGKLGDLFGRRPLFLIAIGIFLLGSLLSGTSQSMGALIGWRALQGMGGGGLIVLAQAIIADVVGPRGRAKYQGYFGAVIGAGSVGGPLLGGFITDNLSWRYVFFVNLPLGLLAIVIAAYTVPRIRSAESRRIDWLGFGALAIVIICVVLITTWGGSQFEWDSPMILSLGATALVFLAAFLITEGVASEPALPLRLFSDRTFVTSAIVGFMLGFGMFGVISFIPLFLQVVTEVSATSSGLQLVPLMVGMVAASTVVGRIIGQTGRYKIYPVIGAAIAAVSMYLLSTMGPETSEVIVAVYMGVLGLGLGMVQPVIVIAVQSGVAIRDMGTATANVGFFRSMGAAIGVAVFGDVFNFQMAVGLESVLPAGVASELGQVGTNVQEVLATLPPDVRTSYVSVVSDSLTTVFLWAAPVMGLAFLVSLFMPSLKLRDTSTAEELALQDSQDPDAEESPPEPSI